MHRRNRHIMFQAKYANADIVLDARALTGLSNGGAVNTWRDLRDGSAQFTYNNAYFSVPGAPAYVTNVQGGQPAVRFIAAGRFMSRAWSTNPTNYVWIITEVPKTSLNFKHAVSTTDGSFNQVNFSVHYVSGNTFGTDLRKPGFVINWTPGSYTQNSVHIQSLGVQTVSGTSTGYYYRNNSSTNVTAYLGVNTTYITLGGRNGCCDYVESDILQFLLFSTYISKSLRRRFEIASSFTFKIQDVLNGTTN